MRGVQVVGRKKRLGWWPSMPRKSASMLALAAGFALLLFGTGAHATGLAGPTSPSPTPGVRVLATFDRSTFGTLSMALDLADVDADVVGVIGRQRTMVIMLPTMDAMAQLARRPGVLGVELDVRVSAGALDGPPRRTTTTTAPTTTTTTVAITTTTTTPSTTTTSTRPTTTTTTVATTTTSTTVASTTTTTRRPTGLDGPSGPPPLTTTTTTAPPTTTTTAPPTPPTTTTTSTTVPSQSTQQTPWGIARVGASIVWAGETPGRNRGQGVNVAILDTGVDVDHPDLVANIEGGYVAIADNPQYPPGSSYDDDNGHGSHVAGIVAAADNLIGVVGVAPEADLYAVKVLDSSGSGWTSDVVRGVNWAIDTRSDANPDNDIQVVNMSLSSNYQSTILRAALADAETAGILLVAAAGNDGGAVDYPAAESQVMAVAATGETDLVPSWSSRGPQVELAAPGWYVLSTYVAAQYGWMSGTSMAAPHVSGAAALVWAARPDLTAAQVRALLTSSAQDLGAPGWDSVTGAGLVRPDRALGL